MINFFIAGMIAYFAPNQSMAGLFDGNDSFIIEKSCLKAQEKLDQIPACKIVVQDQDKDIAIASGILITDNFDKTTSQALLTCAHALPLEIMKSPSQVLCYWDKNQKPIKVSSWEIIPEEDIALLHLTEKIYDVSPTLFKETLPTQEMDLVTISYGFSGIHNQMDPLIINDVGSKPHWLQGKFKYDKETNQLKESFELDKFIWIKSRYSEDYFPCYAPKPKKKQIYQALPSSGDSGSIWLAYDNKQYYIVGVTTGVSVPQESLSQFYSELGNTDNNYIERKIKKNESKYYSHLLGKKMLNKVMVETTVSCLAPHVSWIKQRLTL